MVCVHCGGACVLWNLPVGSGGLCRVEDVFGMPLFVGRDQSYPQVSVRMKSGCFFGAPYLIVLTVSWFGRWALIVGIFFFLTTLNKQKPTWLSSDGWSSGAGVTGAFIFSQVMDASCRPAQCWMSSALHLVWTRCGVGEFFCTSLLARVASGLRTRNLCEPVSSHPAHFQDSLDGW